MIAKIKDARGCKYRMFFNRYNKGELKHGAALDLLIEHGYKIDIKNQNCYNALIFS
jgi:hypothetical protein